MIRMNGVTSGYGDRAIVQDIDLAIREGEFFALLGPNGSGKTTLFQLVTANLPIWSGSIDLAGRPLQSYSGKGRAKLLSVLSQEEQVAFDFIVRDIVMLGRYPHQEGWIKTESAEDAEIVENVMRLTGVSRFADVPFWTLSGGEKQRVLLARALAQEPKVLLLDEPTNHLDIRHTFEMLGLLKEWQRERGLTVFAILHDLNIASLYADRIGLIHEGKLVQVGDAHLLKNEQLLECVYGVRTNTQYHPRLPKPQLFVTPGMGQAELTDDRKLRERCILEQDDRMIHLAFDRHLRTLSNGVNGEGFQWGRHFCNFYVDRNYDCSDPQADMRRWLEERNIPYDETVGMMTAVPLRYAAHEEEREGELEVWTMATAGVGNAVDVSSELEPAPIRLPGTINLFVFVKGRLTDGAFVNALLTITEAKTKALLDLGVTDPRSGTPATGTSTDAVMLGATQQGEETPYAGSGTLLGKMIGRTVYKAVKHAVERTRKG